MSFNSLHNEEQYDLKGVWFIGTVVANDDPVEAERIKVTIPKLFEGDHKNLPWVSPALSGWFPNTATYGQFRLVPKIGDQVQVLFQQGKPLYPLYVGMPQQKDERVTEFKGSFYLKRYGFKDPEGNLLFFDTTAGAAVKFKFQHVAGVTIEISNDGDLKITSARDQTHIVGRDFVVTAERDVNITAADEVNVHADNNVKVNDCDVLVTGGDVVADGISLKSHVHTEQGDGNDVSPPH